MTENENHTQPVTATAIALHYDGTGAPKITATGQGLVAEEILRIAKENDVPLYADSELVALLAGMDLGEEIPVTLYLAVARVIAFAYQLSGKKSAELSEV
jgi:flagellar biosynthesis protein